MYCSNCGKKIDPNAKFCPYCGYELMTGNNIIKWFYRLGKGMTIFYVSSFLLAVFAVITTSELCKPYNGWPMVVTILFLVPLYIVVGKIWQQLKNIKYNQSANELCDDEMANMLSNAYSSQINDDVNNNYASIHGMQTGDNNSTKGSAGQTTIFSRTISLNQYINDNGDVELLKYANMHTGEYDYYCCFQKKYLIDPATSIVSAEGLKSNADNLVVDNISKTIKFSTRITTMTEDNPNDLIPFLSFYKKHDGVEFQKCANKGDIEYYCCFYTKFLIDASTGISSVKELKEQSEHLWVDTVKSRIYSESKS